MKPSLWALQPRHSQLNHSLEKRQRQRDCRDRCHWGLLAHHRYRCLPQNRRPRNLPHQALGAPPYSLYSSLCMITHLSDWHTGAPAAATPRQRVVGMDTGKYGRVLGSPPGAPVCAPPRCGLNGWWLVILHRPLPAIGTPAPLPPSAIPTSYIHRPTHNCWPWQDGRQSVW